MAIEGINTFEEQAEFFFGIKKVLTSGSVAIGSAIPSRASDWLFFDFDVFISQEVTERKNTKPTSFKNIEFIANSVTY